MSTDPRDDVALFDAWAAGDPRAGAALVRRYFDLIFRFFDRKVHSGAEDLAQQTFLECLAAHDRYRGEGSLRAFILGIARRQLGKHLRKSIRGRRAVDMLAISMADVFVGPSSVAAMRDVRSVLAEALRHIPVDLQTLVELRYWEGLPVAEIGRIMEISEGTVKSRLSRARAQLRGHLEHAEVGSQLRQSVIDRIDGWHEP